MLKCSVYTYGKYYSNKQRLNYIYILHVNIIWYSTYIKHEIIMMFIILSKLEYKIQILYYKWSTIH